MKSVVIMAPHVKKTTPELSFSHDGRYLVQNRLSPIQPQLLGSARLPTKTRLCLHAKDPWVVQGNSRLLWLPPSYRAMHIAMRDGMLATMDVSGRFMFFKFDLDNTPLAGDERKCGRHWCQRKAPAT
ncbi:hypothetical protein AOQ84DRAFT_177775 [Glonium stellatum]|uniref:Uncharacterized protein n=1 Tax=Glonium stellatum TaxID=574774 RepID=A0A8E2F7D8_9PEZI|nr:hypothetical protein AOQ84DRAFT_177775 [Glonium stellatum]